MSLVYQHTLQQSSWNVKKGFRSQMMFLWHLNCASELHDITGQFIHQISIKAEYEYYNRLAICRNLNLTFWFTILTRQETEGVKGWPTTYVATVSLSLSLLLIELECNYACCNIFLGYLISSANWEDYGQWPAWYRIKILSQTNPSNIKINL